jgi:hypothetical protein
MDDTLRSMHDMQIATGISNGIFVCRVISLHNRSELLGIYIYIIKLNICILCRSQCFYNILALAIVGYAIL